MKKLITINLCRCYNFKFDAKTIKKNFLSHKIISLSWSIGHINMVFSEVHASRKVKPQHGMGCLAMIVQMCRVLELA